MVVNRLLKVQFGNWIGIAILSVLPFTVSQAETITVEQLLQRKSAPAGVIFEIVSADRDALEWAVPQVRQDVVRLRKRFPDMAVAVVSHGQEQFALQTDAGSQSIRQATRSLIQDESVSLHVCGTYAEWFDVSPEAFPDYVDVAPAGPTQINLYKEVGYVHIVVKRRK